MTDQPSVPSTNKEAPPTQATPKASVQTTESKARSWLIFGLIGVLAAVVFGILYLFVLAPTVPDGSVGWFLFSFATGLTMIVMPCTLPLAFVIVPLSMGKGVIRGLGMALAFGLGVATMLSTYGIIAALLGGVALDYLGTDIEVLKNWVYFFAGIFAFIFALSEIGLMNVHMPSYSGAAPAFIQKRSEIIKAFLLGLFLGNVGVGCPHPATPLILIEIASSGDVLYGWLMFLVHAIGRVLPLLLLAFMAILGVNGLNWLMARKATVERVTGWAMVFVAGFILTLGLFTHDWWVNSGIHNALEKVTQESFFNSWFNAALNQNVAHVHGIEEGVGLFGQPLEWGHWFLVMVWIIPIWWWWWRKRKNMYNSPAFALKRIELEMDRLENDRERIEETANIDGLNTAADLKAMRAQIKMLKEQRRAAAKAVEYGEQGNYKSEVARDYEVKILGMQRNYFIVISLFLALIFIYYMPTNFFLAATNPNAGHGDHGAHTDHDDGIHAMPDGTVMDGHGMVIPGAHVMPDGSIMLADGTVVGSQKLDATPYSTDPTGLPMAQDPETVFLEDGDTYDIVAEYVQKEVGNRTLRMLAYNRSVPGPFIKAQQGAEITINFTNLTDLDQTIHSHGLRLDNNFDGVPGVTQDTVQPGQSFTYTIKFEDGGVYWYHPHTRDDYGQEMGLYGNYLVDPTDGYPSQVNREVPLVIDDILIENDRIAEFYKELTNFALLGRFGNEFLVNGEQNYTLTAKAGEVVRFLVTNVSNARTYNLSLPGAEMKLVAADVGMYERETFETSVLISPAERMVVEAYFEEPGTYQLLHTMPSGKIELVRILVTDEQVATSYKNDFRTLKTNNAVVEQFKTFRSYLSKAPDKSLLLTVQINAAVDHSAHMHAGSNASGGVDHSDHAHSATTGNRLDSLQWEDPTQSDYTNTSETIIWKLIDQATGRESMDIPVADWTFKQGSLVKVRLTNDAQADHVMQHPIHLHGQQFVVLAENGVPNNNLAWKDTVLVFPGETVDILVDMSNLGEWMSHCHISEHLHAGMMMQFRVEDENGYATGDEYRATVPAGVHAHQSASTQSSPTMNDSEILTPDPKFTFNFSELDTVYSVTPSTKSAKAGVRQQMQLSFYDKAGNPVNLDDSIDMAVTATFVKSDNSLAFVTYPGNTVFPQAQSANDGHTDHDHGSQDDGHDHSHSLLSIPVAYAHGEMIDDGHHANTVGRTYTIPVEFPERGVYRGFVAFMLEGESEPRIASFDVEVASASFSVNDFGWSPTMKWWVLLITSLLLMIPLTWGVRKYVNVT